MGKSQLQRWLFSVTGFTSTSCTVLFCVHLSHMCDYHLLFPHQGWLQKWSTTQQTWWCAESKASGTAFWSSAALVVKPKWWMSPSCPSPRSESDPRRSKGPLNPGQLEDSWSEFRKKNPSDWLLCLDGCFRRLWQHVTEALRQKDIEKATEHKRLLEERQRTEERHRAETETPWRTRHFDKEVSQQRFPFSLLVLKSRTLKH